MAIYPMPTDHENKKDQRESHGQPVRDRLDWISNYLELADRIIEDHVPNRVTVPETPRSLDE